MTTRPKRARGRRAAAPALIAAVTSVLASACGPARAADSDSLLVFAAASTTDAVEELASSFEARFDATVHTSFAASSTLAKQIEAGAPAAVFLSASTEWMDYLQERGHVAAATRWDLLANQLALIAPADAPFELDADGLLTLANAFEGRLALGDPDHVPAGRYAREALVALGAWPALEARLIPAVDVRSALRFVETGEAGCGVVYASDAAASTRVTTILLLPPESHTAVRYPVAAIAEAGEEPSELVREFLTFLRTPQARAAFARAGFREP